MELVTGTVEVYSVQDGQGYLKSSYGVFIEFSAETGRKVLPGNAPLIPAAGETISYREKERQTTYWELTSPLRHFYTLDPGQVLVLMQLLGNSTLPNIWQEQDGSYAAELNGVRTQGTFGQMALWAWWMMQEESTQSVPDLWFASDLPRYAVQYTVAATGATRTLPLTYHTHAQAHAATATLPEFERSQAVTLDLAPDHAPSVNTMVAVLQKCNRHVHTPLPGNDVVTWRDPQLPGSPEVAKGYYSPTTSRIIFDHLSPSSGGFTVKEEAANKFKALGSPA